MRYSQQRGEGAEGNQELFYYNQFTVVTDRQQAKFGIITTYIEKRFFRWIAPYPFTLADLQTSSGTSSNDQQRLVVGMCHKPNFLNLIETFTLFSTNEKGEAVKIVARYQLSKKIINDENLEFVGLEVINGYSRNTRQNSISHLKIDFHPALCALTSCTSGNFPPSNPMSFQIRSNSLRTPPFSIIC